jgi:hypothetical protein
MLIVCVLDGSSGIYLAGHSYVWNLFIHREKTSVKTCLRYSLVNRLHMKTRRLSRGRMEAYNSQVRIRLEHSPGKDISKVTIYRLKPNRYYAARRQFEVQQPITIQEVVEIYGGIESISMLTPY